MLTYKLMFAKEEMWGAGRDELGAGDEHAHTTMCVLSRQIVSESL